MTEISALTSNFTAPRLRVLRIVQSTVLTATLLTAGLGLASPAVAVTGCSVWANTDFRAYAQCSGGRGEMRAGAACTLRNGWYVRSAYGQWVTAGKPSVADCGFPFQQIDRRNGRPVVWWETR